MERKLLGDKLIKLFDLAEARLVAHRSSRLAAISMIMRQDRTVDMITYPLLALQLDTSTPINEAGFEVAYNVPLRLVVQHEDPDFGRGFRTCLNLVGEAQASMTTDPLTDEPEWMLFDREGVDGYMMRAGPLDMPAPIQAQGGLLQARATFEIRVEATI